MSSLEHCKREFNFFHNKWLWETESRPESDNDRTVLPWTWGTHDQLPWPWGQLFSGPKLTGMLNCSPHTPALFLPGPRISWLLLGFAQASSWVDPPAANDHTISIYIPWAQGWSKRCYLKGVEACMVSSAHTYAHAKVPHARSLEGDGYLPFPMVWEQNSQESENSPLWPRFRSLQLSLLRYVIQHLYQFTWSIVCKCLDIQHTDFHLYSCPSSRNAGWAHKKGAQSHREQLKKISTFSLGRKS